MEDNLQVALISHMPDPELTITAAAMLSTSGVSSTELSERMQPELVARHILPQALTTRLVYERPRAAACSPT